MSKSEILVMVAGLSDDDPRLQKLRDALGGDKSVAAPESTRLLGMKEAAAGLNISRSTLWRLVKENRIRAVEIRRGSRRIPESELGRLTNKNEGEL